jgi:hypothetical protein
VSAIKFRAKIEEINSVVLLRLPMEASGQLPSRSPVMIKGFITGNNVVTPLEPDGEKGHFMLIDKKLQESLQSKIGDILEVELEATKDWLESSIPKDFYKP